MSTITRIEHEIVLQGRRDNQCWFAPGMAVASGRSPGDPPVVMAMVQQLVANDNGPIHCTRTHDMGRRWTPPVESQNLYKIPLEDDAFKSAYLRPVYHRKTDTLLGLGETGVPGYTLEECDPIRLDHVNQAVTWKGSPDLGPLVGRPVYLRFQMQHATLYGFALMQEECR